MARLHPVFPDSASIMAKKLSTSQASPIMITVQISANHRRSEHAGARRLPGGGRSSRRGHPLQRMTPCVPACAATARAWRNRNTRWLWKPVDIDPESLCREPGSPCRFESCRPHSFLVKFVANAFIGRRLSPHRCFLIGVAMIDPKDASYIQSLEVEVAKLRAEIEQKDTEIKRLKREKGISSARDGLTFNQHTGLWADQAALLY